MMTKRQIKSSNNVVKCPKCNELNRVILFRCSKCRTQLRPQFLVVLILCFTVGGTWQILSLLWGMYSSTVSVEPYAIFRLLKLVAGVVIGSALYCGRYWSWIAVQISYGLSCLVCIILLLLGKLAPEGKVSPFFILFYFSLMGLIFCYLYRRKVRAFCSVGRSFEISKD